MYGRDTGQQQRPQQWRLKRANRLAANKKSTAAHLAPVLKVLEHGVELVVGVALQVAAQQQGAAGGERERQIEQERGQQRRPRLHARLLPAGSNCCFDPAAGCLCSAACTRCPAAQGCCLPAPTAALVQLPRAALCLLTGTW